MSTSRFVDAFMGVVTGNGTKSAIHAGYSLRSARTTASRVPTRANIQAALAARIRQQEAAGFATAVKRDQLLSKILRASKVNAADRISAISEMNKCEGRHSMIHGVKGRLTLEEALGLSREVE
jgi:phage terminase small subunit